MSEHQHDKDYTISKPLVHGLIIAIFASLISIAGYMVRWNVSDNSWKAAMDQKLTGVVAAVSEMKVKVAVGQLPQAAWRLDTAESRISTTESWINDHERSHHSKNP